MCARGCEAFSANNDAATAEVAGPDKGKCVLTSMCARRTQDDVCGACNEGQVYEYQSATRQYICSDSCKTLVNNQSIVDKNL